MRQRVFLVPLAQRNTLKWFKSINLFFNFIYDISFNLFFPDMIMYAKFRKENVHCFFSGYDFFLILLLLLEIIFDLRNGVLKMISFVCQMLQVYWRFLSGGQLQSDSLGKLWSVNYFRLSPPWDKESALCVHPTVLGPLQGEVLWRKALCEGTTRWWETGGTGAWVPMAAMPPPCLYRLMGEPHRKQRGGCFHHKLKVVDFMVQRTFKSSSLSFYS